MSELRPEIRVYSFRHAVTQNNIDTDRINGRSNEIAIKQPEGVRQSIRLAANVVQSGILPDEIRTSPAKRTLQTAEFVVRALDWGDPLIVDDDLQEISQGDWEGDSRAERYTEDLIEDIKNDPLNFRAPGGESLNDGLARKRRARERYVAEAEPEDQPKVIFEFTHGLITRIDLGHMLGWDAETIRTASTPNTSVSLAVYRNGMWVPEYVGKDASEMAA